MLHYSLPSLTPSQMEKRQYEVVVVEVIRRWSHRGPLMTSPTPARPNYSARSVCLDGLSLKPQGSLRSTMTATGSARH